MSSLIGCLLAFLLIIFFYISWPLIWLKRFLFGNTTSRQNSRRDDADNMNSTADRQGHPGKIFRQDEGEYIDFEEMEK